MKPYLPSAIYVLTMAIGIVLLDRMVVSISPLLGLFITALFALIFFHVFKKGKIKDIYSRCCLCKKDWLIINIYVFVIWLASYHCVTWTSATSLVFISFMSFGFVNTAVLSYKEKKIWKHAFGLLVPILSIGVYAYISMHSTTMILGIFGGVVTGVLGWCYSVLSKKFAVETGLSAGNVLATRFYLTLLVLPFFIDYAMIVHLTSWSVFTLITVSIFTFIVPLYANQLGVMRISITRHTAIVATTPIATFICQGLYLNEWSGVLLIMSILTSITLMRQW